jgi:hypothetical protein
VVVRVAAARVAVPPRRKPVYIGLGTLLLIIILIIIFA